MLSVTQTGRRELRGSNRVIAPHRSLKRSNGNRLGSVERSKSTYEKRKANRLCAYGGCVAKPEPGHTRCRKHLQAMSKRNKEQYQKRIHEGLCFYCGQLPPFWGVRCIICRQRFTKHPLPYGARRALRLYRDAEKMRERERIQAEARHAVRKLLASGDINKKSAKALRLYAGIDNGKWRTYNQVGQVMKISKERVRQLLLPSKITLTRLLGDSIPWMPVTELNLMVN